MKPDDASTEAPNRCQETSACFIIFPTSKNTSRWKGNPSSYPFYVFSHGLQGETPPWPAAQACHLTRWCTKIVLVFAPRISLTFGVEHADIRHLERFHANQTMSAVSSVQELAASEGFVTSQQSEMWHKISIQIVFKQSFPNNFFFCEAIFVAGQTRHLGPCRPFLFRPTSVPSLTWLDLARSLRSQHQRTVWRTATGGSRHVWCRLGCFWNALVLLGNCWKLRKESVWVELRSECLSCQWDYPTIQSPTCDRWWWSTDTPWWMVTATWFRTWKKINLKDFSAAFWTSEVLPAPKGTRRIWLGLLKFSEDRGFFCRLKAVFSRFTLTFFFQEMPCLYLFVAEPLDWSCWLV